MSLFILGIVATLAVAALAFFCAVLWRLGSALLAHSKSLDETARSMNQVANTMYGLVPNLKRLGDSLEKHVIHMGGLIAVIEDNSKGQPPPMPLEPPKPEEENFSPVMPPQVDWENGGETS